MAYFKKLGLFAAPMALVAAGAVTTTACSPDELTEASENLCGPCGEIELGDVSISGSAQLDGFFAAVGTLNSATVSASADFEGGLSELEAVFGLDGAGDLNARVEGLIGAIEADFGASADASLAIQMTPAQCTANISVAVEAQANCEAKAECEVTVDPGSAEVECSGECTGSCSGGCEAEAGLQCEVSAGGVTCEGACEGTCELSAGATCEGTCKGACDGTCSASSADGTECAGECDGACDGECELAAGANCEGSCHGSCTATAPEAGCEGGAEAKCEGECSGGCSGGCTGEVTPPKAEGNCEASAKCEAQASAQGSASMECTPPSITIDVAYDASLDASARAELAAKVLALKAHGTVMIQSFVKLQALITGEVNNEVAFEVSPLEAVIASLSGVVQAGASGELIADLPAGRLPCAFPAVEASATMLGDMLSEGTATVQAQASFAAAFSTGFQS